jgi:pimeloyl-ACP methyl ester carboxylesterase
MSTPLKKDIGIEGFERTELCINGVKTVVYTIGHGEPIVFLHGGGTFTGFEFARRWAGDRKVVLPYHPGFGESDDDPLIDSVDDYLLHYLDLFDALALDSFDLVGHSLGGWFAAEFAARHSARLRRLVLMAPSGLVDSKVKMPDFFTIRGQDLPGYLMVNPENLSPYMPKDHDVDFLTQRYRETTSVARISWDRPSGNPKLSRWLHRINLPTLLLWGEGDRLVPVAHAAAWQAAIGETRLEIVPGVGHLIFEERPEAADIVLDFLGEADSAGRSLQ